MNSMRKELKAESIFFLEVDQFLSLVFADVRPPTPFLPAQLKRMRKNKSTQNTSTS